MFDKYELVARTIESVKAGNYEQFKEYIDAGVDLKMLEYDILGQIIRLINSQDANKQEQYVKIMELSLENGLKATSNNLYGVISNRKINKDNMKLLFELLIEKGGAKIGEIWKNGANSNLNDSNPLVAAVLYNNMDAFDFFVQKVEFR